MAGPRRVGWARRLRPAALLAVAMAGALAPASPAAADPAAPGDVRSAVEAVVPGAPGVTARVVGGDSFLELTVDGHEVEVLGYEGEPYLRFGPDGTVEENLRSPATYLNGDRFADTAVPDEASADAAPSWDVVGDGGRFAWHDHRIHFMGRTPPPQPTTAWVVPVLIDGRAGEIRGHYELVASPSPVPWLALAAAIAGLLLLAGWRGSLWPAVTAIAVGALTVVVGVALRRLPGGGVDGAVTLLLGVVAVAAAAVSLRLGRRPTAGALLAGSGVALLLAGLRRLDVLSHAVLVTSLPAWCDRSAVALALGVGAGVLVVGVRQLLVAPVAADDVDR